MSWVDRLRDFGIEYGQLPGTQTLWDAATVTSDDVMARLALVNLLHEARGLDTFTNSHKVSQSVLLYDQSHDYWPIWSVGVSLLYCLSRRGG
jgi:hypothetical protein